MEPGLGPREVPSGSGGRDKCEGLGQDRMDRKAGRTNIWILKLLLWTCGSLAQPCFGKEFTS